MEKQKLTIKLWLHYEDLKMDNFIGEIYLLKLFRFCNNINTKYTKPYTDYHINFNTQNTQEGIDLLTEILKILENQYIYLKNLGILWGFTIDFIQKYNILSSRIITFDQLKLMKNVCTLYKSHFSIQTNGYSIKEEDEDEFLSSNIDEKENNYWYEQILFYLKNDNDNDNNNIYTLIIKQWCNIYKNKYSNRLSWLVERNSSDNNSIILALSFEPSNDYLENKMIIKDMFYFVNSNKLFFQNYIDKTNFEVFHYKYDGGEIGYFTLKHLIDSDIDLLITKSNIPITQVYDTIDISQLF